MHHRRRAGAAQGNTGQISAEPNFIPELQERRCDCTTVIGYHAAPLEGVMTANPLDPLNFNVPLMVSPAAVMRTVNGLLLYQKLVRRTL